MLDRKSYIFKFYRRAREERRGIRKTKRGLELSRLKLCALGDLRGDKSLGF